MGVLIRPAGPGDDAALQGLDAATWSNEVSPAPLPEEGVSFFDSTRADEVLAAEENGTVLGYVTVGPVHNLEASSHVLELKGLAVHPDHQGRGTGLLLVQAAVGRAREREARRLVLRVLGSNEPARRLYERCGFVVEGVLRQQFLLGGRYVDDVLMALDLVSRDGGRQAVSTSQSSP